MLISVNVVREKDLQRQVTLARSQLRELRTTADTSQARLLDHSQRQGAFDFSRLSGTRIRTWSIEG